MRKYTVSQTENGLWYAHKKGFPNLPVMGSFSKSKRSAQAEAAQCMAITLKEYFAIH